METCLAIKAALSTSRPKRSAQWLASQINIKVNRMRHILRGKTPPKPEEVDQIRGALRLPSHWPHESPRTDGRRKGELVSLVGTPLKSIPLLGSVAAGYGLWNVDSESLFVKVPAYLADLGAIGFIVDGDSMMPMLRENDTAVFKERRSLLQGYVFLVKLPDDGYIVKRAIFDRRDWYLESLNRAYNRFLVPDGSEIVGILVGWFRTRGSRETSDADPDGLLPDEIM